jgi:hypothetical protein
MTVNDKSAYKDEIAKAFNKQKILRTNKGFLLTKRNYSQLVTTEDIKLTFNDEPDNLEFGVTEVDLTDTVWFKRLPPEWSQLEGYSILEEIQNALVTNN